MQRTGPDPSRTVADQATRRQAHLRRLILRPSGSTDTRRTQPHRHSDGALPHHRCALQLARLAPCEPVRSDNRQAFRSHHSFEPPRSWCRRSPAPRSTLAVAFADRIAASLDPCGPSVVVDQSPSKADDGDDLHVNALANVVGLNGAVFFDPERDELTSEQAALAPENARELTGVRSVQIAEMNRGLGQKWACNSGSCPHVAPTASHFRRRR
jgi:hypothetical protein